MSSHKNQDRGRDAIQSPITEASVLAALSFGLCAVDRDLQIVYTNAVWDRFMGMPDGVKLPGIFPKNDLREPERSRWEGIARVVLTDKEGGQTSRTHILDRTSPDGGTFSLRIYVTPIRNSDGQPVGVLFAGTKIEDAETTVQQRRAEELARIQVARQLAATLNHEINNPLFIISATLEDLLAEAADPANERMLHASLEAVWQVSAAVKQLSEIRQIVTTAYITGHPMIDLEKSQERLEEEQRS